MKFDPLKSFGYPVLRPVDLDQTPDLPDYIKSTFQPSFSMEMESSDPSKFAISYDFSSLSLKPMKDLVEEEKAKYMVRIVCRETYFSQIEEVGQTGNIVIDGNKLRDWIDISGYVIAGEQLKLKSDQINEEYGYTEFTAEEGAILAWAPPTRYVVEKDFYRNIRSIFEYKEDDSLKNGQFFTETDKDYIFIYANSEQIRYFRNGQNNAKSQSLLLNSVFFPAVMQMAIRMQENEEEALRYKWGKIFAAKCAAKNIDYAGDPNLTAQALLGHPLKGLNKEYFE